MTDVAAKAATATFGQGHWVPDERRLDSVSPLGKEGAYLNGALTAAAFEEKENEGHCGEVKAGAPDSGQREVLQENVGPFQVIAAPDEDLMNPDMAAFLGYT